MKFLLVIIPGIIAYAVSRFKSKYREKIIVVFLLFMIVLNVLYNRERINALLPLRTTTNQLIYQQDYAELKEFPDALIPLLIKDKTVCVKNDYKSLYDALYVQNYEWLYSYYHKTNPTEYLKRYGANVIDDDSLNNTVINDEYLADFDDIGYANDMLRNAFLFYPEDFEPASYFYHYYYYREYIGPMHVYINFDGIVESDELVFLWQNDSIEDETETLFLMTKKYYDRNFK